MQDFINSNPNDEIELREYFITLWAYKIFIIGACALGIMLSIYYINNVPRKYTSSATFKMGETNNNISFSNELGSLANLVSFGGSNNFSTLPTDQVMGRLFIQKVDAKLHFQTDPYFNTYDSNSVDPIWKYLIKKVIGWQKFSTNTQEAIWQSIVAKYNENIMLDLTADGSIKIFVTHKDAERAAEIANGIMNEIISDQKNEKEREQNEQLSYLSNTLAKALGELEISQSNLKQFALRNSALPLDDFAAGSLQLDTLREKLKRASNLLDAVAALSLMLKNETTNQNNYLALRNKYPIVDQVEFRRVLGQNEIINSWSWPDANSVNAVFDTLSERKSRLQSQINASQIDAERSGVALETYAKLERNAKVAEATYTVLIEQVKAQSMMAGFQPETTKVYEYASASINPSSPNRKVTVAAGGTLGIFLGAALSLVIALTRSICYSKKSLITAAHARQSTSVKPLLKLRNKSLKDIITMLTKKPYSSLRDMAVNIHKSGAPQVLVTSTGARLTSNDAARALASYMQSENFKIAIIDFSSKRKKPNNNIEGLSIGSFVVTKNVSHVSVLKPKSDLAAIDFISRKDFYKDTKLVNSSFNLVFLCADDNDAISLLSSLEGQNTFHITIARTKKTKFTTLRQMRSLIPIQGLLYD